MVPSHLSIPPPHCAFAGDASTASKEVIIASSIDMAIVIFVKFNFCHRAPQLAGFFFGVHVPLLL
jgi:hypothetical protein